MGVTVGKTGRVRLYGPALLELREECYARDNGCCVVCGRHLPFFGDLYRRAHMAHKKGRGAGGSDTLENVELRCYEHHIVSEHAGGKVVPAKVRVA